MRRAVSGLGIATLVTGVPLALLATVGPPAIPSFEGSDGWSGSYVPPEAVLGILGLLAWALWAYLALAVLLNLVAELAAIRRMPAGRALAAASALLTPRLIRRLVELAVGSAVVAASMTANVDLRTRVQEFAAVTTVDRSSPVSQVSAPPAEVREKTTYRVRPGDSLWRIAERTLGSGFRWREIYRLNRDRTFPDGGRFTNPHHIHPGWVLELPDEKKRGSRDEDEGPEGGTLEDAPASPNPGGNGQVADPTPAATAPAFAPEIEVSANGEQDVPEVEEPEIERPDRPVHNLPSGLAVAASFASGMLTAHLLGRLHRRRARRPLMPEPDEAPEPPLAADLRRAGGEGMAGRLDVALHAVCEAWTTTRETWPRIVAAVEEAERIAVLIHDDGGPLPPRSGGSVGPVVRFSRDRGSVLAQVTGPFPSALRAPGTPMHRGALVPLGQTPEGAAVHCGLLAGGPLGIDGGMAADLARQMVVAAAGSGSPDDVEVTFLGTIPGLDQLQRLPHLAGAHPWDRSSGFLRDVQAEFVRRARLFLAEGVEELSAHLAQRPDERFPLLLLVADEPPNALRGLVESLAREAPALGAALIGVGWQPSAASLRVQVESETDLRTDLPGAEELLPFLLPPEAAQDAIKIIARAYPQEQGEGEGEEDEVPQEPDETGEAPIVHPGEPTSIADAVLARVDEPTSAVGVGSGPKPDLPPLQLERDAQEPETDEPGTRSPPDVPAGVVAVRCLGPTSISRDGRPFRKGWRAKSLEMVAFLVANPSGVPRDRIIEELWPETDLQRGSDLFYAATSTIRGKLRVGEDDQRRFVDGDGQIFRLEEGEWWADVWEFERLATEGGRADDDEAIDRLRDALALYRGDFCADNYYSWTQAPQEHLRSLFIDVSARLADLLSTREEYPETLAVLDRAMDADPVCEDVCRRAMLTEASLGRRSAALARYRKLETTLARDLGVEPDPETQSLAQELARQKAPKPAMG